MADLAQLLNSALVLDVRERAVLVEKPLASLDNLSEEQTDHLWAEEAQRRLEELRAGSARALESHEVMERVHKLFR